MSHSSSSWRVPFQMKKCPLLSWVTQFFIYQENKWFTQPIESEWNLGGWILCYINEAYIKGQCYINEAYIKGHGKRHG